MPIPAAVHAVIDLSPSKYQASLNHLRDQLQVVDTAVPFLRVAVKTPKGEFVELQVRRFNAYIVAFKGADEWYFFEGETDGWGKPAGVSSNYNNLGKVGTITLDDLNTIGALGQFRKGVTLDKRSIAIIIALVSEASRFATVATYFTGLTNSRNDPWLQNAVSVDWERLRDTYFTQWDKPPSGEVKPGEVVHYTPKDILFANRKGAGK